MRDYFEVGLITTTHGLKGEVKVFVISDDPKRLESLDSVFIMRKGERTRLDIESVRYFKNQAIVKFRQCDTIDDVMKLRGEHLYIDRSEAEPLEEGEYYLSDLIGCTACLEDGSLFGEVRDVLQTGANDVLVVARNGRKDALIPVIKDCIVKLAPEEKMIVIHLIEGLVTE